MIMWISSMKRIGLSIFSSVSITVFILDSTSPRYFEPAIIAVISSSNSWEPFSTSGTVLSAIIFAIPRVTADLPTPGSPTCTGLDFSALHKTCRVLSMTSSLPMNGFLYSFAFSTRFLQYSLNAFDSLLGLPPIMAAISSATGSGISSGAPSIGSVFFLFWTLISAFATSILTVKSSLSISLVFTKSLSTS